MAILSLSSEIFLLLVCACAVVQIEASLTAQQKSFLLSKHNEMRRAVSPSASDMRIMTWDDGLARVAQSYAQRCNWQHNARRTTEHTAVSGSYEPVGENLYLSTHWDKDFAVRAGMKAFDDEKHFYTFRTNACSKEPCGHYTQVVWSSTEKVGCGIHRCNRVRGSPYTVPSIVMVCNYGPTGNWRGQRPYKQGEQCSHCPEGRKRCIAGLCFPGTAAVEQTTIQPLRRQVEAPSNLVANSNAEQDLDSLVEKMDQRLKALEQGRTANRPSAHLNGVKDATTNPTIPGQSRSDALFWSATSEGSHLEGGFSLENGRLIVPSNGLYFVYSQVWTSREGLVRHFIYAGPRRLMVAGSSNGNMQTTWLGGVHHLNKGDELRVVVVNKAPNSEQSVWPAKGHSYFGAFKL